MNQVLKTKINFEHPVKHWAQEKQNATYPLDPIY